MKNELLKTLKTRFEKNMSRHQQIKWDVVQAKLEANPSKLSILEEMERTGGEPDVIGVEAGEFIFCDCAAESPIGRRSLCYDRDALEARKANKPSGNAMQMAALIGIEMLNEAQYRALQELGSFDTKTSSWIETPTKTRDLGGALFCDRRYNQVFTYHNGADSYYGARGFRGRLKI